MGLNDGFTNIRGTILAKTHLPTISTAMSLLAHDENQRGAGLLRTINTTFHGSDMSTTFMTKYHTPATVKVFAPRRMLDNSKLICEHCGGTSHTKETCFFLYGFHNYM